MALSWQWTNLPDRERITISLDKPDSWSLNRVGQQAIELNLSSPPANISNNDRTPATKKILHTVTPSSKGIYIFTKTNAFGYIVNRQGNNEIRIDLFPDPLGARWKGNKENEPLPPVDDKLTSPEQENLLQAGTNSSSEEKKHTQIQALIDAQNQFLTSFQFPETEKEIPTSEKKDKTTPEETTKGYVTAPDNSKGSPLDPPEFESSLSNSLRDIPEQPADNSSAKNPPFRFENRQVIEQNDLSSPLKTEQPQKETSGAENSQIFIQSNSTDKDTSNTLTETNTISEKNNPLSDQPEEQTQKQPSVTENQPQGSKSIIRLSIPNKLLEEITSNSTAIESQETSSTNSINKEVYSNTSEPAGNGPVSEEEKTPPPQIEYDEDGNPIVLPSPEEVLTAVEKNIAAGSYDLALNKLYSLKGRKDLTQKQREDTLYFISDSLYGQGSNDFMANGDKILAASEEALNSNLKSDRAPSMLLRLGFVNLKMGNVKDAEAYFNLLKRKYPNDENIPLIYYYWGDYFFDKEKYQQASDQFQYIVHKYPESPFVREASVGLAKALYKLGYYDQSFEIVDYIEKRWPRFYMEYPPVLSMIADASYQLGKYDSARNHYWLYYNLQPSSPEAATILTRLGDIYLNDKKRKAAKEVYEEAARRFPNEDSGMIAMMRLAEEGINDAPSIADMFNVFDRPYTELPYQTYNKIIKEHPNSKVAPLANLKLAMWYLWNKRYTDALREATNFEKRFPGHPLLPKAKEVAMNAFAMLAADGVQEKEYGRILKVWDEFTILQEQKENLGAESRLALAFSQWNKQRSADALETLKPFFLGAKDFSFGEPALNLAMTILVDTAQWDKIAEIYNKVEMWELTPSTQRQLDYAMALAAENLGKSDLAVALWESLKQREDLPPDQKAYMYYFLSRAAYKKKDMETAYYLGRDSLQDFTEMAEENPEKADTVKIKDLLGMLINITEGAGRIQEALDWQQQYAKYVKPEDDDYPSMRYHLGQLYKKSGDMSRWGAIMQELTEKSPNSLFGRMAASDLRMNKLNDSVNSFLPPEQ